MDGVHAQCRRHRQQDGREDRAAGDVVHEHAHDQQEHVHDEQHHDLVAAQAEDEGRERLGHLLERHHIREARGHADDKGRRAGDDDRVLHAVDELLPADLLVDKRADDERIHARHSRRLGGGKLAGIDAAEDDDRAEDRPERVEEGLPERLEAELAAVALPAVALADVPVIDHQRDAHHKARQDTGLEEVADGGAGRDAVDHERDGRRNDDADRARRGGERRGIALVIALLLHLGDHERADGRHRRRAGAGDGRVEHGGERRDRAETAGEEADDIVREVEQALGDAAVAHEVAREHEERNRHQGEAVDAREGILCDHDRVDIRREDEAEHRRKTHRDADGQADRAEHDQTDKQNR